MKQQSKFSQQLEQQAQIQHSQQSSGREFTSAEELIRFDAAQTTVPPQIEQKLKHSIGPIPPQKPGWLKRFFK